MVLRFLRIFPYAFKTSECDRLRDFRYASEYEYASAIILLHEFQHALGYRLDVRFRYPWLYALAKMDLIV